jgi:hypothetical protein
MSKSRVNETPSSALFKYQANPDDKELRDDSLCSENPDPDFWSNAPFPVWAICGPYHRAALKHGDIVFFIPQKYVLERVGIRGYIFAGFLVVGEIRPTPKQVRDDPRIRKNYYHRYKHDLNLHLRDDPPHTKAIRPHNFIVGTRQSKWFGPKGPYVRPILRKLELHAHLKTLGVGLNNSIPRLTRLQAERIRKEILSTTAG